MGRLFNSKSNIDQKYYKQHQTTAIANSDSYELLNNNKKYDFSFERFDTYKGLFNTQQLLDSVDFNLFQNHCFFDSAVAKVEYTFNKIFDEFPIDGKKEEFENFLQNLDGFGRFIYNKFDKNLGYLKFNDSYIEIQNKSGYLTSFNRNEEITSKISKPLLNPKNLSFSFDFRLFVEYNIGQNLSNQVIFQYVDNVSHAPLKNGMSCFIKNINEKTAEIAFIATNGVSSKIGMSFLVDVNKWNHIVIVVSNLDKNVKSIKSYVNTFLQKPVSIIEEMNVNTPFIISDLTTFLIGKGHTNHSNISSTGVNLSLQNINNFKGFIDEFRYYHTTLTQQEIIKNKDENVYANDSLKMYFKFNEPSGVYEKNLFCFDSSGNSLHSRISLNNPPVGINNIRQSISNLRYNPLVDTIKPSILFEIDDYNPCLMPTYVINKNLNEQYLEEAKSYDNFNPNLIFKLFPKHYFKEGSDFEGLNEDIKNQESKTYYIDDNQNTSDTSELNYPGQQKKDGSQTFAKLLLIWARFVDEIKVFLDILPKMLDVSYSDTFTKLSSTVNFFIPIMAKLGGFEFKEILVNPQSNQLMNGYIIGSDGVDKSSYSIRYIQNELWKRILINSKDIISSKGTKNAIRSIFNSVGIIPEEFYRFREYGKSNNKFIENSLIKRTRDIKLLSFNNKNDNLTFEIEKNINNIFKNNDFTFEIILNYDNNFNTNTEIFENIFRLENTQFNNIELELVYIKSQHENLGQLKLIVYNQVNFNEIIIENVNLFDYKLNYINFSILHDINKKTISLNYIDQTSNIVKSMKIDIFDNIMNQPLIFTNNNNKKIIFENSQNTQFSGNICNIRLWKDILSKQDMTNHIKNPFSISNDKYQFLNFNNLNDYIYFDLNLQDENLFLNNNQYTDTDLFLLPIDYSENEIHDFDNLSNYPFKIIIKNELKQNYLNAFINKSIITLENDFKFDEPNIENKIIPMGYFNEELAIENNVEISPVYEINYLSHQKNDVRFSIEMSNTKHLNEDMGKLFNSIDFFADIISDFGNLNDSSYNKFEKFSDFYFKRLKNTSLNMIPLYELYQIMDNVLTEMLNDFIASKVKFNNNIYVIESHTLERHKFNYKFLESHIVMKGNYDIISNKNTRKSNNYLRLEGRKLFKS